MLFFEAYQRHGRRRSNSDSSLRVSEEVGSQFEATNTSGMPRVPWSKPQASLSPTKKIVSRLSAVTWPPFFDKLRGRTAVTKVDGSPSLESQVNPPLDAEDSDSQDEASHIPCRSDIREATVNSTLSLVPSDVTTLAACSLSDRQAGVLGTGVGKSSTVPEDSLATSSTSMLKEQPTKSSQLYLQHEDMILALFLRREISRRRCAICEEIESTLNIIKINGCKVSLKEFRIDLAVFHMRRVKSLELL